MSDQEQPQNVGPWGSAPRAGEGASATGSPKPEPLFNAPWPSVVIVATIVASYALQSTLAPGDAGMERWGFSPAQLDHGHWLGLLTVMFVHIGWTHALMNALGALAFGPPVARLMGPGLRGAGLFFLFYLVCGLASTLGYTIFHLHSTDVTAGASGAIAGLMGAAARLLGPQARPIAPIHGQAVISIGIGWVVVNLLMALFGGSFIAGARLGWEAHIAGFIAGVLLVGPFAYLAGWRRIAGM